MIMPKENSDQIRLCVDLFRLNKFVQRERYQSDTPAQAVVDIAAENAKVFTKLDALKGYHQCPLDEESQLLTTFITPFGRFKFLPLLLPLSAGSSSSVHRLAYLQFQNITTATWTNLLLGSLVTGGSLTTSSFTTVTKLSTLTMSANSYVGARRGRSR